MHACLLTNLKGCQDCQYLLCSKCSNICHSCQVSSVLPLTPNFSNDSFLLVHGTGDGELSASLSYWMGGNPVMVCIQLNAGW